MEKLMAYSPQDVPENSRRTPYGSSDDMDFNDVFGGPPRRYSMQEVSVRYSFGETVDSSEDDRALSPWIVVKEKPVFGEEVTPRRRRQGDDFYGDIFGGDESHSSPRKTDRDSVFGSNPGSRAMSPARPFTPKAEPYGTSLPTQFSLSAKTAKASEHPVFASRSKGNNVTSGLNSPLSPSTSLSRFSNRAGRGMDEIRSKKRSPLSHEGSSSSDEEEEEYSMPGGKVKTEALKKETVVVDSSDNQFHFSIYKWAAGGGVPMLIMPITSRVKAKDTKVVHRPSSKEAVEIDHKGTEPTAAIKPQVLKTAVDKKDPMTKEVTKVERKPSSKEEETVEARRMMKSKQVQSEDVGGKVKIDGEMAQTIKDFLMSEELARKKGKLADEKENTLRNPKRADSISRSSSTKNVKKDAGTGKVKEFVQIFSQEADLKPKPAEIQTKRSQSFRWREVSVSQGESEPSPNAASAKASVKLDNVGTQQEAERVKLDNVDTKQEAEHVPPKVVDNTKSNKPRQSSSRRSTSHRHNLPATQNKAVSQESLNRDPKISLDYPDDLFEDNFEVEELSEDPTDVEVEGSDDTKAIDAKIQQWSFGKKGNIRSLLSTLQYVLWAESGWKPVPLMDLIEGNAVKRAYQKALLRLHPDKLQQKGAEASHKYIAEKVFDILQEAWDHFNTLAPL